MYLRYISQIGILLLKTILHFAVELLIWQMKFDLKNKPFSEK